MNKLLLLVISIIFIGQLGVFVQGNSIQHQKHIHKHKHNSTKINNSDDNNNIQQNDNKGDNQIQNNDQQNNNNSFVKIPDIFQDSENDDRLWKDEDWTIYKLLDTQIQEDIDDCQELRSTFMVIKSWVYFFEHVDHFFQLSLEDMEFTRYAIDDLMEARQEVFDKLGDIQDKYRQEEQVEDEQEQEESGPSIIDQIFGINSNSIENRDSQENMVLFKKIQKVFKEKMKQREQFVSFIQSKREGYKQIQLNRNRMLYLHKILMNKGKEFRDILIQQGPLGGGDDLEELYQQIQTLFDIIFQRYDELREQRDEYDLWSGTVNKLHEDYEPHYKKCVQKNQ